MNIDARLQPKIKTDFGNEEGASNFTEMLKTVPAKFVCISREFPIAEELK